MEYFSKVVLLCIFSTVAAEHARGPPGSNGAYSFPGNYKLCDQCEWISPQGAVYDLSKLCEKKYSINMENPRASRIEFGICDTVKCNKECTGSMACIHVPANDPTTAGNTMQFQLIQENIPSAGVMLTLTGGAVCSITKQPRTTTIQLKCLDSGEKGDMIPSRAWEGEDQDICSYYIEFSSPYACPLRVSKYAKLKPKLTAVTGCVDTVPSLSTYDCFAGGGTDIVIHGLDFTAPGHEPDSVEVMIHGESCRDGRVINAWKITCKLAGTTGENHGIAVTLRFHHKNGKPDEEIYISNSRTTVSFKPLIDYKRHFDTFVDLGVGGLTEQIKELYQRAFASRGIPATVLQQLGIDHAKGILLYGPPGSGKTLLAKTIAKILHTDQVKLINAPEIMSKYLGESEKNLRGYFEEAEKAWVEMGEASDLYVIVIDEIDAICKPRGKSDSSAAAAAYDSVVNQLLTKMDGLRSLHNILVIGMTNRRELIDPALLRPGRFEIQIEIGLPDERGRWEIFYIHTRKMSEHGYLSPSVSLEDLARNTSQMSGAEIAGIVRLAASYALDRKYSSGGNEEEPLQISHEDFTKALKNIKPAYTQREDEVLAEFLPQGFVQCGQPHDAIVAEVKKLANSLQNNKHSNIESVLFYGPSGTGKTGLAAHIASIIKFAFVKVLTPLSLLRLGDTAKEDLIIDIFSDANKAETSIIILDDLHRIIELIDINKKVKVSHSLLHTFFTVMTAAQNQNSKILVIGTLWSDSPKLEDSFTGAVGLQDVFNSRHYVPYLKHAEVLALLEDLEYTRQGGKFFRLPQNLEISLRNMIKVTDCLENKLISAQGKRSQTPQDYMDQCFSVIPHQEQLTVGI